MRIAVIEIEFEREEDLDVIFRSIEPEIKKKIPKTEARLDREDRKMILRIESEDTISLRAACNSFLRWIDTARSLVDILAEDD